MRLSALGQKRTRAPQQRAILSPRRHERNIVKRSRNRFILLGCVPSGWFDRNMLLEVKIRRFSGAVSGALFVISALLPAFVPAPTAAQVGEPIKVGYGMALTGGIAANGRAALLPPKTSGAGTQCQREAARRTGRTSNQ